MNVCHRTLWNSALGAWVAVSEIVAVRGKRSRAGKALSLSECPCPRHATDAARLSKLSVALRLGAAGFLASAASSSVMAACSPASPAVGATVTCTGVPSLPLFLNTFSSAVNGLFVNVNSGAQMNATLGGRALTLTGNDITLTNLGTIDPALLGTVTVLSGAVVIGNTAASFVNITNAASGIVKGTADQSATLTTLNGLALNVNNGAGGATNIVNNGTINSTALSSTTPVASDAALVGVYGGSQVTMVNSSTGTVTGRIAFETSTVGNTFTNSGAISGSVSLGAGGGNTFTAVTGSSVSAGGGTGTSLAGPSGSNLTFAATGQIDGGSGGNNALVLQNTVGVGGGNTGTGTASSATYANFSQLTVESGTWTLQGPLVTGTTTLFGGVAVFGNAASFGSGVLTSYFGTIQASSDVTLANPIVLALNGGNLTVQGADGTTLTGVISGGGRLIKSGSGQLALNGANTYTGNTTLSGGSVQLGNHLAFGTGSVTVSAATTLSAPGTIHLSNALLLNSAAVMTTPNSLTLAGTISGTGGLGKSGVGSLTISGNNAGYSGTTSLNTGSLLLGNNNALGSGGLVATGGTSLDATSAVALANAVTLNGNLNVLGSNALDLSGVVSGSGGLTKSGTASLTLSGSNTYTGATNVNAGTLYVNGDQATATGTVTVASGGTLGGSGTLGGAVTVQGGGHLAAGNSPGTLNTGALSLSQNSQLDFEFGQAGTAGGLLNDLINVNGNLVLDGQLNASLAATGAFAPGLYRVFNYTGTLTDNTLDIASAPVATADLSIQTSTAGQVNLIYSIGPILQFWDPVPGTPGVQGGAGIWQGNAGNSNWIDDGGSTNVPYTVGAFPIFQGTGGAVTVDSVSAGPIDVLGMQFDGDGYVLNGGTLQSTSASTLIRVGAGGGAGADTTATINSVIADDNVVGGTQLTKTDAGTLVLGGVNTYRGGTLVSGGTLQVGADNNLGDAGGGLTLDGGTLRYGAGFASARAVALGAGGGVFDTFGNNASLSGAITGAGSLTKAGAGTLTLAGGNSYSGGTALNAGTLTVGTGTALGSGALDAATGTTLDASTAVTLGNVLNLAGSLAIGGSADLTLGGAVNGAGGLTKNGAATLTLNGTNAYLGGTTLNAGTLVLGSDGALGLGALTAGAGTTLDNSAPIIVANAINLDGAFTVAGSNDLTLSGNIGGVGALTKSGLATLTLTGANSYAGATQVTAGTLLAGSTNTLPTGTALTIASGASFDLNGFDGTIGALAGAGDVLMGLNRLTTGGSNTSTTFSGSLGAGGLVGGLTKTGSGTLSLTGNSGYTGTTDIQGGTIAIDNGQALGHGTVLLSGGKLLGTANLTKTNMFADEIRFASAGGTLAAAAGTQLQYTGTLSFSNNVQAVFGSTTDTGTVLLNLSAIGPGSGNSLRVAGGTLKAGNNQLTSLTGGSLVSTTIDAGATLDFNGMNSSIATLLGAGTLQTGAAPGATLTLNAGDFSGTIQGASALSKTGSGTLVLSGNNSYSGATNVNAGTLRVNGDQSAATGTVTVADGAALGGSGTLGGSLVFSQNSRLDFAFGQAGTPGGSLNDLISVNGNLVLDGQLHITTSAGGTFAPGLYRVFNYTGSLTDNTLDIASAPVATSGLSIQTASAGQVNLVNSTGVVLQSWDPVQGTPGVQGGAGIWQGGTGNNNWINDGGSANVPFATGAFTVFQGGGGAVTVDSVSAGPIDVSGMQFDGDGYVLNGGTLQTTSASTLIRVGAGGGAGADTTATINSVIADDNVVGGTQLTKTDAGTLVLGGANTYRGGTLVGGGTLQVGADNHLGAAGGGLTLDGGTLRYGAGFASARAVALGAGGGVFDTFGNNASLSGAITGAGSLTKAGAGTLTLTNVLNNYSGGTTVSGGTLQGTTQTLQGNITNNANVTFDQAASGTYAGTMTGSGSLTKLNAGALTLTGSNSYSGGTTVSGGTLQGSTDTLQGNIVNDANVTFNQADAGTYAGAMTGSGSLTKTGAGTLLLTSALNNYTGGTVINGGLVQGDSDSLKGNIVNNASQLVFDQTTDSVYAGALAGSGGLTKTGAGNLNLTGISSLTGATRIDAGTLSVNGSIANSAVTVNAGGTLGGNGTVGSTAVLSGGVFAPGNSIGTITVNGSLSFAPGSVYRVETDPAGNADRINVVGVPGTATLNGGRVDVRAGSGTYQQATQYTILNAVGGVTGNFADVTSDLAFLTPTLAYDPGNVFLTLTRNDVGFASVGTTSNQIAVGTALQSVVPGAQGGALALIAAVNNLSAAQARGAFDQLSGEIHASASTALLEDSRYVREAGMDRVRQAQGGVAPGNMSVRDQGAGSGSWARLFGTRGHIDGDGNAARLDRDTSGLFVGADTALTSGWRVGGLAGYSRADLKIGGLNSSAKADSYHLGVYGGTQWDATSLRLGAAYSWNKLDTRRGVAFTGLADNLSAEYDASTTQVFGEVSQRIDMDRFTLEPFAGLGYVKVDTKSFRESGGAAALNGAGTGTDSTFSTLGVRASTSLSATTRLSGTLGWRHASGDRTPTVTNAFGTGSAFTVAGAPLVRNAAVVEVGVQTQLQPNMMLSASYAGQFGNGLKDHGLKIALDWRF